MNETNLITRVEYTDPELVTGIKTTETPRNPSLSGYGAKIPTRYMVKYGTHWRRVYVMNYGNSGSAYVLARGKVLFLDTTTEYAL